MVAVVAAERAVELATLNQTNEIVPLLVFGLVQPPQRLAEVAVAVAARESLNRKAEIVRLAGRRLARLLARLVALVLLQSAVALPLSVVAERVAQGWFARAGEINGTDPLVVHGQ